MKNPFAEATPVAKKLKILLYGTSGSGKTVAALSFPRVAIVDAEGGTDLYAGRPGVAPFSVLRAKTVSDLETAIAFIRDDNGQTFDTLVVDPMTVFYDVLKEATARTAKGGTLGYREWAAINNRMKAIYNSLTMLPVHVVVIGRESTEYETVNGELRKTGVKPDADKALPYVFDFVVRMNADHSGTVVKARGLLLGNNGALAQVNWDVFEPAANAYTDGEPVTPEDDEDAARREADDMRNKDVATDFYNHWIGQSLSKEDVLAALRVRKFSEWTQGRAAADEAVNAWIGAAVLERDATAFAKLGTK